MGFILDEVGKFSVELRRDSFKLYSEDFSGEHPAPEFDKADIGDLIACLQEAKMAIEKK